MGVAAAAWEARLAVLLGVRRAKKREALRTIAAIAINILVSFLLLKPVTGARGLGVSLVIGRFNYILSYVNFMKGNIEELIALELSKHHNKNL